MKVNGNDPTLNLDVDSEGGFLVSSIPIRLEIASRLMAGNMRFLLTEFSGSEITLEKDLLSLADALIKAHNETCGGD